MQAGRRIKNGRCWNRCSRRSAGWGRPRLWDRRQIVNAILYVLATGCQWRALPRDFPPRSTVQGYFCRWRDDGTWDWINAQLVGRACQSLNRTLAHRPASSTARAHRPRKAAVRLSQPLRSRSKRYGINPKTVAKWTKRGSVADLKTGPKQARSTVLSIEDEAIIVAFRKHTLLPLDDCLYALQATIPNLSRSSFHRCFQRHGISRVPDVEDGTRMNRTIKDATVKRFYCETHDQLRSHLADFVTGLQFRQAPQAPQGSHALRVHLQTLDKGARPLHRQSAPENAGTKQACAEAGTWPAWSSETPWLSWT
ncbi:MAG: transposase [Reyranella sp.]|nr:transposase [Reyranella sp.]